MILIGALARIKNVAATQYLPNLETEAILESVSSSLPSVSAIPIRSLNKRSTAGQYFGARQRFSITFNFLTSIDVADKYFRIILDDSKKICNGSFTGSIKSFSNAPFAPICISSAEWSVEGEDPVNFSVTFDYFNMDDTFLNAQPIEQHFFDITSSEWEIDLRSNINLPYETEKYELAANYEVDLAIDGYEGIRYGVFTLTSNVNYYDTAYNHVFKYDSYYDSSTIVIDRDSSIQFNNKLMFTVVKSGILMPSSDSKFLSTIEVFK